MPDSRQEKPIAHACWPGASLDESEVGAETLRRVSRMTGFNHWVAEEIAPYIGDLVVEVGCGLGNITRELLAQGKQVVAVDRVPHYIEAMRGHFGVNSQIDFVLMDILDPASHTLASAKPDSVVCLNVLEHIPQEEVALRNMRAILPVGGRLVLLVPAHPWLYGSMDRELGHVRRYSRRHLAEVVDAAGFVPVRTWNFNLFGLLGWFIAGRIMKQRILPQRSLKLYERLLSVLRTVEKLTGPPIGQSLFMVARARGCSENAETTAGPGYDRQCSGAR